ncbi:hypothetical protein GGU10DRAFT_410750 [Lentinula aff. detonsa]|uniref:Uncharacterized protein n=1 Tax=Lentinula aff. detonsa TaxID=2804958 RepID=A0AA38KPB3_9AGAR|nr:hypothetical protein GGU10DRAFT_410750 [Lentinula aff. detonsa]
MTPSSSLAFDEGKRRSSMDKTKVSHLSRQLQLRLQYAKLKVEHGWHKQNLNEVENLYFRRTNSRPRQQSAYGPITQTSYSSTNNAQPLAPQTLSFKAHAFSSKVSESEQVRPHNSSAFPSSLSSAVIPSVHSATPPIAVTPNDAQSSSQGANNSPAQTSSLLPSPHIGPTFSPVVSMSLHTNSSNNLQVFQPAPSSSSSIPHTTTSYRPAIPLSARALQKQPQSANEAQLTSTATAQPRPASISSLPAYPASVSSPALSVFPTFSQFTASPIAVIDTIGQNAPSLTYDSFWSSHNASVIAKRPLSFRTSVGLLGASGEFGAGIGTGMSSGVTAYPGSVDTARTG